MKFIDPSDISFKITCNNTYIRIQEELNEYVSTFKDIQQWEGSVEDVLEKGIEYNRFNDYIKIDSQDPDVVAVVATRLISDGHDVRIRNNHAAQLTDVHCNTDLSRTIVFIPTSKSQYDTSLKYNEEDFRYLHKHYSKFSPYPKDRTFRDGIRFLWQCVFLYSNLPSKSKK